MKQGSRHESVDVPAAGAADREKVFRRPLVPLLGAVRVAVRGAVAGNLRSEVGMNSEIDLQKFCSSIDMGIYAMTSPWVRSGWRYATDARIVVRVPAPGEADTISTGKKFARADVLFVPIAHWRSDAPIATADVDICPECAVLCPKCDGYDEDWDDKDGQESSPCPHCTKGYQYLPDCPLCGDRRVMPCMRYGTAVIGPKYHYLIATLPGLQWANRPAGSTSNKGISFRFDGGEGVVAGRS